MNQSSYSNSPSYRDAGCPSQCMSENTYSSIEGFDECSESDYSDYLNPESKGSNTAKCNAQDNYSKVNNIYSPSTIYIPPASASRIYNYPITVDNNFKVVQPQIVNWKGDTQFNNLTGKTNKEYNINDVPVFLAQAAIDVNNIEKSIGDLQLINKNILDIKLNIMNSQGVAKVNMAKTGIELSKKSRELYKKIAMKAGSVVANSRNIAVFTVRDTVVQPKIDALVDYLNKVQTEAKNLNNSTILTAQLLSNVVRGTAQSLGLLDDIDIVGISKSSDQLMSANTTQGQIEPYQYAKLRNRAVNNEVKPSGSAQVQVPSKQNEIDRKLSQVQKQLVDQHNQIVSLQQQYDLSQHKVTSPVVLAKPVAKIANVVAVQAPKAQAIVSAASNIKKATASIPVNVGVSVQNPAMIAAANKVIYDANKLLVENKKHMSNIMREIPFIINSLSNTYNIVSYELRMAKKGLVKLDVKKQENKLSKIKYDIDILKNLHTINIENFSLFNSIANEIEREDFQGCRCRCGESERGQCRRCE